MVQEYEGGLLHLAQTWNQARTHRPARRQSKSNLKSLTQIQNDEQTPNNMTIIISLGKAECCLKGKNGLFKFSFL